MRLMRLSDAPIAATDRIYRYDRLKAVMVMTIVAAAAGATITLNFPPAAGPFLGGFILLLALLFRGHYSARFLPTNWLVRTNREGAFIKFRSFMHHHFPSDDITVVFVPYDEIRAARLVTEKTEVLDHDGDARTDTHRWLELDFINEAPDLRAAIVAEARRQPPRQKTWYGHTRTSYGHLPVRMRTDGSLQVEWHFADDLNVLFNGLQQHARIDEPVEVRRDFTKLGTLQKAEQEAKLLELIESGQTLQAVKIARQLYGMGLEESKQFVKELQST